MDRKAYFGKDNITPDFLRSAEKTAENSIHKSSEINNKTAQETALTSEKSSNHFNYTGRGKTLAESLKKSKNRNRLGSLKKSTPAFWSGALFLRSFSLCLLWLAISATKLKLSSLVPPTPCLALIPKIQSASPKNF